MIIYPAVDLFNGNVVKLEARDHKAQEKVYGAPGEVADRWLGAGAEWLHVVDLNAALGEGRPNAMALLSILPRAARAGARVQWGGGVRETEKLKLLLETEVGDSRGKIERAVIGTRAITDWAWLEGAAAAFPERILVAIDGAGREVLVAGWQQKAGVDVADFLQRAKDLPLAGFLYTNVAVEGRGAGVDWEPVKTVIEASSKPVVFSGGISTLDDVARFKELGAHGIIIGSALYSGQIDFSAAKALAS